MKLQSVAVMVVILKRKIKGEEAVREDVNFASFRFK